MVTDYSGFVTVDNLKFIASDGVNTWEIDDSGDIGYYPYSSSDPASGTGSTAAYAGGVEVHQVGIVITGTFIQPCFKTG